MNVVMRTQIKLKLWKKIGSHKAYDVVNC